MEQITHKKAIWAWTMYDWANSAFATTIMAAVLPVYYTSVAAADMAPNQATAMWGYTSSVGALIAALISPILGAVADFSGSKKRFLTIFMGIGVAATALMYFISTGDWLLASLLFVFGQIGFAGSLVYYDALLPHVAGPDEIDMVSSRGYAMGYIGGGILLAVNLAMILLTPPELTGSDDPLKLHHRGHLVVHLHPTVAASCLRTAETHPARGRRLPTNPGRLLPPGENIPRDSQIPGPFLFPVSLLGVCQWNRHDHYHGDRIRK